MARRAASDTASEACAAFFWAGLMAGKKRHLGPIHAPPWPDPRALARLAASDAASGACVAPWGDTVPLAPLGGRPCTVSRRGASVYLAPKTKGNNRRWRPPEVGRGPMVRKVQEPSRNGICRNFAKTHPAQLQRPPSHSFPNSATVWNASPLAFGLRLQPIGPINLPLTVWSDGLVAPDFALGQANSLGLGRPAFYRALCTPRDPSGPESLPLPLAQIP